MALDPPPLGRCLLGTLGESHRLVGRPIGADTCLATNLVPHDRLYIQPCSSQAMARTQRELKVSNGKGRDAGGRQ
jgi:hypothetical protein